MQALQLVYCRCRLDIRLAGVGYRSCNRLITVLRIDNIDLTMYPPKGVYCAESGWQEWVFIGSVSPRGANILLTARVM